MVCFCIAGLSIQVTAQDNSISKITIASPTAASLGKFGDIPVSYHTGIPQVSIPIYTITAGSLSLPISLSYHAGGLKVQEPAGWVGTGWALNAGGVITRSVMGGPDEKGTNYGGLEKDGHFSNYGYNNYYTGMSDWLDFSKGFKDGEPDLYFFNFGSYSGKFYFRDDRTPVIVPEQDFKIIPAYDSTTSNSIQSFVITTPDGVQYSFGNSPGIGGTAPVEITKPITSENGMSNANVISSWFLNKISSPDSLFVINLSYQPEVYGYHTFSMFPIDAVPGGTPTFGSTHGYELIKNIVLGVRLSQIIFPNGVVNFIPTGSARTDLSDNTNNLYTDPVNTSAMALGSIQIKDSFSLLRAFNFSYGYFTDNTTALAPDVQNFAPGLQSDRQRLRLDQVQEVSGDGTLSKPPHAFSYFSEPVPRRLSFGIDHWGFYNGITNNAVLIPTYTRFGSNTATSYPGANRDASWPAMRGGTMQQITYPTGGSSLFEFESNTVYNTTSSVVNSTLANLSVHNYGQATNYSSTASLTSNGSAMSIVLNNTSNYGATLSITDNTNKVVYTTPIGNNTNYAPYNYTLASGTYQVTLSLPNYSNLSGGVTAAFTQYITVITSGSTTIGGNRIKTITHNDGVTSNPVVTGYSYLQDNGQSSAILYSIPAYVGIIRNDILKNIGYYQYSNNSSYTPLAGNGINGCLSASDATLYISPSSIRPMAASQGYHIGYAQVKVTQSGNGYSLYKYYGTTGVPTWQVNGDVAIRTVNTQGCDANAPNYPAAPLPFDYMRGELKYEAQYNQAGLLLKETSYTPTYVNSATTTPGFIVVSTGAQPNGGVQLLGTKYELSTAHKTQTQVVETVYSPISGSSLTTTSMSYYESAFHHQITHTSSVSSKNELLETKKTYALDYRLTTCDGIVDGLPKYTSDCSSCLTNYNTSAAKCSTSTQCTSAEYLKYIQCLIASRVNYITYQRANFRDSVNAFKTNHDNAKAASDASLKPVLEMQDRYQNPVMETTVWKSSKLAGATFNQYDFMGTNVYPSKIQAIRLSALSTSFSAAYNTNSSLSRDGRYADETTAKFSNGTLVEITGKDGLTTAYIWGYNKAVPIVKSIGVSYATLQTAYNNAGGNLLQLYSQPLLASAMLATYTYRPLVGMTSETEANGKMTYYEYDSLQRLRVVRNQDKNILKTFCYSYAGQPENCSGTFYSTAQSATYTRNNCGSGFTAGTYTTTTVANAYSSMLSIGDANQQALNYIGSVGQSNANTYGSCTQLFYNTLQSGAAYTRNNCGSGYTGGTYTSTVAANTYSSSSSVADANQQAQNYLSSVGQSNANQYASCSPIFYNTQQSGTYTRNDCGTGYIGGDYTTTIVANSFSSSVSVADANQQAQNYIGYVGQNNANQYGSCTYNGGGGGQPIQE